MPTPPRFTTQQLGLVFLVAVVQLVNVLDFVMVMPLGPWFAHIGVPESAMGVLGASYTLSAAFTGLVGAAFLDRFDRKRALLVALVGLALGTLAGGLAVDLPTLVAARVVAGAFGGPATSLAFSIVADTVGPELRGRAMGIVMGAFSFASIVGVPFGLWCAEQSTFRAPFFVVTALASVVVVVTATLMPPMRAHLTKLPGAPMAVGTVELLKRPTVQLSYALTGVVMMSGFLLIPNLSNYLHLNFGVPLTELKSMYLVGGFGSLLATQAAGWLVDRHGSFKVGVFGSLGIAVLVFAVYYRESLVVPAVVLQSAFMVAMGFRNVPYNALTSKVPAAHERARFQSLQSAVQHGASGLAGLVGAALLHVVPRAPQVGDVAGREPRMLEGMPTVAALSIGLSLVVPVLMFTVEHRVAATRARGLSAAAP